jgi:hypothetical protein
MQGSLFREKVYVHKRRVLSVQRKSFMCTEGVFPVQRNSFACVQKDGSLFGGKVLHVFRGRVFMCSCSENDVHEYRGSVPVQRKGLPTCLLKKDSLFTGKVSSLAQIHFYAQK